MPRFTLARKPQPEVQPGKKNIVLSCAFKPSSPLLPSTVVVWRRHASPFRPVHSRGFTHDLTSPRSMFNRICRSPATRLIVPDDNQNQTVLLMPRFAFPILSFASTLVALLLLGTVINRDQGWLLLLDNLHWTVSFTAAAALGWLGVHAAKPKEKHARR